MNKSFRQAGLPLSVGLLGFIYLIVGVFQTFHSLPEISAVMGWLGGSNSDFHPTVTNALQPLLAPILALVGLGLWLRSGVARGLALGVSYLGISVGVLTVLLSLVSPQALEVIFGSVKYAEGILGLPRAMLAVIGVVAFGIGVVQYGILMAQRTRQAFNFG